jgi:arsenate reductase
MKDVEKKTVLFICTHNSARSQMAEGLLRNFYGDSFVVLSAGTNPSEVHPYAIKAMMEIGIDISNQRSKSAEDFIDRDIDYVVTVCDNAREVCPFFPGGKEYIHKNFDDPGSASGAEDEVMNVFRRVRDEIKDWIKEAFRNKKVNIS